MATDRITPDEGRPPGRPHGDVPSVLEVDLLTYADELSAALLTPSLFTGLEQRHAGWLRQRYEDIVPIVLPDALRCVGTGEHLTATTRSCIRESAVALRGSDIPFTVALRGGVPALRAFGAYVLSLDLHLSFGDTTVLMGRAGLIAQELGACWVEAWREADDQVQVDGSCLEVAIHGRDVGDAEGGPVLEMVALAAVGQSTEQIATATAYSPQAVKWHLSRLMRSWKVGNRSALIAVAFVRGVLVASRRESDTLRLETRTENPASDSTGA